jgi:hypothetical protein
MSARKNQTLARLDEHCHLLCLKLIAMLRTLTIISES